MNAEEIKLLTFILGIILSVVGLYAFLADYTAIGYTIGLIGAAMTGIGIAACRWTMASHD